MCRPILLLTLLGAACTRSNPVMDDGGPFDDGGVCADEDGDGTSVCAGDCDDADPNNFPGNNEICGDSRDNNCAMDIDEGCNGLGTFVSGLTGSDGNPGTQAAPVQTIAKGMANAVTIGGARTVFVAGTHYPEKVTLVEGVSLHGGHACGTSSCSWAWDPVTNDTAIDGQDFEGVLAGASITKQTRLEGFRLRGKAFSGAGTAPGPTGSACLSLDGGSPTIRNNTFEGAAISNAGANGRSIGIAIYAPTVDQTGAVIDNNRITAGSGSGSSFGIWITSKVGPPPSPAVAVITNNTIASGTAPSSSGIQSWNTGAGTLVQGNTITAGSSTNGSWGMSVGSTITIDSNRINVDQNNVGTCSGAGWCGGISSASSTSVITNNVVFGVKAARSTAVLLGEFEVAAGAVVLNGNYLDGAGIGLAANPTASSAIVLSVGNCNACGVNAFVGKIRNNILLGGNNLFRFGVAEDPNQIAAPRTIHADALENNDFFFAVAAGRTDAPYRLMGAGQPGTATSYATVSTMEASVPVKNASNPIANLSADPLVDAQYHLSMPASPCLDKGTTTEAPTRDFDRQGRPAGLAIDIGPDEAQ